MNEIECPFCGDMHETYEFLKKGCIGKEYLGVIQLYCPACGEPFEVSQEKFKL